MKKVVNGHWVAVLFMLLIIGPLFLFSDMSPLIDENHVIFSNININLIIDK